MSIPFRIYYGNGTTYSGPVASAPAVNVQAIVCRDDATSPYSVNTLVLRDFDYYLYVRGCWLGVNGETDLIDHVLHTHPERVLKGRMIPHGDYERILHTALTDPDFPAKSGTSPGRERGRR